MTKCGTCQRELEEGMDVLEVQEGVVGVNGFVPLESTALFCSVECLKSFFSGSKGYEQAPRRLP
jgi:hypothetical protein